MARKSNVISFRPDFDLEDSLHTAFKAHNATLRKPIKISDFICMTLRRALKKEEDFGEA